GANWICADRGLNLAGGPRRLSTWIPAIEKGTMVGSGSCFFCLRKPASCSVPDVLLRPQQFRVLLPQPSLQFILQFVRELHHRLQVLVRNRSCNVVAGPVSLVAKNLEFLYQFSVHGQCKFERFDRLDMMSRLGGRTISISPQRSCRSGESGIEHGDESKIGGDSFNLRVPKTSIYDA